MSSAFWLVNMLLLSSGPVWAQTWLDTQTSINALVRQEQYVEALELGPQLLQQTRETFGEQSPEVAQAHLTLYAAQFGNGAYELAEESILQALDIYELTEGPLSTNLIGPYVALGDHYHAIGEYVLALSSYDEARSISRRVYGVLNPEQLEIVDRMSASLWASGSREEAVDLQEDSLSQSVRYYGQNTLEGLAANFRFAGWLEDRGLYRDAYLFYSYDMRNIIDDEFDDDVELQVELLRTAADRFRRIRGMGIEPRVDPKELERALKRIDKHSEPLPRLRAEVLRDLGDWRVTFGLTKNIFEAYEESWEELAAVPDGEQLRSEWFSEVVPIYSVALNSRALTRDPEAPWGDFEAEFTVNEFGEAENVVVLVSNPPGLLDHAATLQIQRSRYRPRIVDGRVVPSTAKVDWEFQYDPDALAQADEPAWEYDLPIFFEE